MVNVYINLAGSYMNELICEILKINHIGFNPGHYGHGTLS